MKSQPLCIGHRGAMGHAPENTLLSIEKALCLGVSWIEIDVYFIDNRLVVIHDERLERTTDGTGYLSEKTFEYLRSLNAGSGQKIPTLEEVFEQVKGKAGLNVELKGPKTAVPVATLIEKQLNQGWNYENILVSSYQHHELLIMKRLNPLVQIGALFDRQLINIIDFAKKMGCYSVHLSIEGVDKVFIDAAHRHGLKVFVFTVNDPKDIIRMKQLGVDGIFTDYPERVLHLSATS